MSRQNRRTPSYANNGRSLLTIGKNQNFLEGGKLFASVVHSVLPLSKLYFVIFLASYHNTVYFRRLLVLPDTSTYSIFSIIYIYMSGSSEIQVFGVNLSELRTSMTALCTCVCVWLLACLLACLLVCLLVCLRPYTVNFICDIKI